MKIHYTEQDEAFRRDVRAFIRQYFTPESPYLGSAAHQDLWETALVEKGWSAYKWPAEHGGIGWNVTQKSIWELFFIVARDDYNGTAAGHDMLLRFHDVKAHHVQFIE